MTKHSLKNEKSYRRQKQVIMIFHDAKLITNFRRIAVNVSSTNLNLVVLSLGLLCSPATFTFSVNSHLHLPFEQLSRSGKLLCSPDFLSGLSGWLLSLRINCCACQTQNYLSQLNFYLCRTSFYVCRATNCF